MSLTGSHECRCGRICNSVREFEKLEAERDALLEQNRKFAESCLAWNFEIEKLEVERDVLKAENLRLREALEKISCLGLRGLSESPETEIVSSEHYEQAWLDCIEIAKAALSGAKEKAE